MSAMQGAAAIEAGAVLSGLIPGNEDQWWGELIDRALAARPEGDRDALEQSVRRFQASADKLAQAMEAYRTSRGWA
jgi:hypothetical protein